MTLSRPSAGNATVVTLKAGEFHFGGGPTRISTLLGSCVSITLWHPRKRIGGSGRRKLHFDLWSGDVWLAFPDGAGAITETSTP